jgi:hypothetical protein
MLPLLPEIWISIFAFTEVNTIGKLRRLSKEFNELFSSESPLLKQILCLKLRCCSFYDRTKDCKKSTAEIIEAIEKKVNVEKTYRTIFKYKAFRESWVQSLVNDEVYHRIIQENLYCNHACGVIPSLYSHFIGGIELSCSMQIYACALLSGFIHCIANPKTTIAINTAKITNMSNKIESVEKTPLGSTMDRTTDMEYNILKNIIELFSQFITIDTHPAYGDTKFLNNSRLSHVEGWFSEPCSYYYFIYSTVVWPTNAKTWFSVKFGSGNIKETTIKKRLVTGKLKTCIIRPCDIIGTDIHFDFNHETIVNGTLATHFFPALDPSSAIEKIQKYMKLITEVEHPTLLNNTGMSNLIFFENGASSRPKRPIPS